MRRPVEDPYPAPTPTTFGEELDFPGLDAWKTGEEPLSRRISNTLRSDPGNRAGQTPFSPDGEEAVPL